MKVLSRFKIPSSLGTFCSAVCMGLEACGGAIISPKNQLANSTWADKIAPPQMVSAS